MRRKPSAFAHREELEVERELLHEQQRHDLLRHLAPEELEPDLRVADVEVEEDAHELLVEPAADAARARVVDVRVRDAASSR